MKLGGESRRQAGFTLIEMMVALAVVILLIGAVAMSFGSVRKARLRKAAVQLSSSIRFGYDRALATGRDFRLVIELGDDQTRYWLEIAEKGAVRVGKDVDKSRDMRERALEEEEDAESDGTTAGGLDEALTLKRAPKPKWTQFKSRLAKPVTIKGARVTGVYLARLDETVTEGRVSLYFWGFGQTERAVLYVEGSEDQEYSILVHPLTGRAKVIKGHYEVSRYEATQDDEGEEIQER